MRFSDFKQGTTPSETKTKSSDKMKTQTIAVNGQTYRLTADDGKIVAEQHNTAPALGAEWQTVAHAKFADGKIISLRGMAWDNAELLAVADALAA